MSTKQYFINFPYFSEVALYKPIVYAREIYVAGELTYQIPYIDGIDVCKRVKLLIKPYSSLLPITSLNLQTYT